jgi:DNA polymerase-3 subunit chi
VTDIAFHFGASDRLAYVLRLLRKGVNSGAKLTVVSTVESQKCLNEELWMLAATDFLPHCTSADSAAVQARSPILLTTVVSPHLGRQQVLVNMLDEVPEGFADFERLIEIVSLDEADRLLARARWSHYTKLGYQITRHDLAKTGG